MKTMSIKEFCTEQGFVQIVKKVKSNANGYCFLTFITADNKAENVYLSKALDELTAEGTVVDKNYLSDKEIALVLNSSGEIRYKVCSKGESLRADVDDLFD